MTSFALVALLATTSLPGWSQDDERGEARPLDPVPVTSSDPSVLPATPRPLDVEPRLNDDGGPAGEAAAVQDDTIPMPEPETVMPTPEGDVVIQPAGGNPYVLQFTGGAYTPPIGEHVAPELTRATLAVPDRRPTAHTYAFVMFSRRMTEERFAELEKLGCRVLGFHPHYAQKVAILPEAMEAVAALDFVRWIGPASSDQKIAPELGEQLAEGVDGSLEIWVNVFESDLNESSVELPLAPATVVQGGRAGAEIGQGATYWQSFGWQQLALEAQGADVLEYVDSIRAFRVSLPAARIERLTELDFVLYVEPFHRPELDHDESTPMIMADRTRASYDGATNQVAIAGIIDSGVENSHSDLGVWGVGWDFTSSGTPWDDGCGHGSHVCGTILGRGNGDIGHTGNAPGLATWGGTSRLFNARIFNGSCSFFGGSIASVFSVMENSYFDGTNTTAKPHVINNSWGTPGTGWTGTDADSRTLDAEVWDHDQLYVFSAGNSGPSGSTIGTPAVAKNAFTVGNVVDYEDGTVGDPGNIWTSSSRGPAGDNRWKPNVSAPGRWINSADSATSNGYTQKSGTSMAAPHVTGVAAQLTDVYSFLRYQPHRLASVLMATAITKDDLAICCPSTSPTNHLNEYGTGRINAYRAIFGTSNFSWTNWGFTQTSANWFFGDFTVESNVERLIVVMTYHEDAASSGASQALVNDIDLWLDQDPIESGGNTGEWFAQQSTRDNTEIRILNNPAAGPWRWKTWPDSMPSSANVSVTVAKIFGDTTPTGSLTVSADDIFVQPGENVDVTATATADSYFASAVFFDSSATSGTNLLASTTTLDDGAVTDLTDNVAAGWDVVAGDIRHGLSRSATWTVDWATEGVKTWSVNARSDNWTNRTASVNVTVDGTPPSLVSRLSSTTHTPNVWSNDPNITYVWNAATDNLSGVDGYGIFTSSGAPGDPSQVKDIEEVTTYSESLGSSASGRYFNIRAVDHSSNWGSSANTGPYLVDTVAPSSGTIRIEGGATTTADLVVDLDSLGASDAHSGITHMQFSNDGSTWSSFEPFATTRSGWNLSSFGGNALMGVKTVWVRYRDAAGNVGAQATDRIDYQPPPRIKTIQPAHGPFTGGNSVTITGDGFKTGMTVAFGGQAGSVNVVDQFTLKVVVPARDVSQSGNNPVLLGEDVDVVAKTDVGSDTEPDGYQYRARR